jgi:hypothetical protein
MSKFDGLATGKSTGWVNKEEYFDLHQTHDYIKKKRLQQ